MLKGKRINDTVLMGIDRKDNTLGYTLENSVPCCPTCNFAKRGLSVIEFIEWARRVYINQETRGTACPTASGGRGTKP